MATTIPSERETFNRYLDGALPRLDTMAAKDTPAKSGRRSDQINVWASRRAECLRHVATMTQPDAEAERYIHDANAAMAFIDGEGVTAAWAQDMLALHGGEAVSLVRRELQADGTQAPPQIAKQTANTLVEKGQARGGEPEAHTKPRGFTVSRAGGGGGTRYRKINGRWTRV